MKRNLQQLTFGVLFMSFVCCQTKPASMVIDWTPLERSLHSTQMLFDTCATPDICGQPAVISNRLILPQILLSDFLVSYTIKGDSLIYDNVIGRRGDGPIETMYPSRLYRVDDGRFVLISEGYNVKIFVSKDTSFQTLKNLNEWERYAFADDFYIGVLKPYSDNPYKLYGTMASDKWPTIGCL